MLSDMSECWDAKSGLRLSGSLVSQANKILKNRDISHATISAVQSSCISNNRVDAGLYHARSEGGVVAPAQFVWLRGYDRALWYPLNNLGRNTFHMEAIGAVAHYKQERVIDRPIPKPKVDFAINTIVTYMSNNSARRIPQLDYSKAKKPQGKAAPKSAGIKKPKTTST